MQDLVTQTMRGQRSMSKKIITINLEAKGSVGIRNIEEVLP